MTDTVKTALRNRIVGTGEEDPKKLMANPQNWRRHPEWQAAAVEGLLEEVGWVQTIMKNVTTGNLVDGHLRVALAAKRGEKTVPLEYVELTEREEKLVLATLDPVGDMATRDDATLARLLGELGSDNAAVDKLLATLTESTINHGPGGGGNEQREGATERILNQAVQLTPTKEYVVVMCETEEEWTALRKALDLQLVRRGGYTKGTALDKTDIERVITAKRLLETLGTRRLNGANG